MFDYEYDQASGVRICLTDSRWYFDVKFSCGMFVYELYRFNFLLACEIC